MTRSNLKINILIADDKPEEAALVQSFFLPDNSGDMLYPEEKLADIDDLLHISILHAVPDAMQFLSAYGLPDIAIVDINFKHASKHVCTDNEMNEGLLLVEELKKYEGVHVFCVTNFLDWNLSRIESLRIGEWAFQKNEMAPFTRRIVEVLQGIAARELATINPTQQSKLFQRINDSNWQNLIVKTIKKRYLLKNLMAGWAVLNYDESADNPVLQFPPDIVEIIKSLLPYAAIEKNQTPHVR